MANTLLTPSIIAKMAMVELDNAIVLGKQVYREYKQEFKKVGDTVSIRRPLQFTATTGAAATAQDVVDANTSIVVNQQKNIMIGFTSSDLTLKEDIFAERIVRPIMRTLANEIDRSCAGLYVQVPHWVGTPGQVINSFGDLSKGPERLDLNGVPTDSRFAVLSPSDTWAMAGSAAAQYQSPGIVNAAWSEGKLGNIAGLDMWSSQNVVTHTVGVATGTPLINGASQNVTYAASKDTWSQSLVTDGWTNSTTGILKAGDIFTIAGVYAVNPVTKATEAYLRSFVVTADANSGASTGPATLTISPPIITSGAYQTASAAPADNAAITVIGTGSTGYKQNLVLHKNAFALAMVDLEEPPVAPFVKTERWNGWSARVTGNFDIDNDVSKLRFDVLYGVKCVNPELATRISGTP